MVELNAAAPESSLPPSWRVQLSTIAWLRWRLQLNALRSGRAKFEFGARLFSTSLWIIAGLGVAFGLGAASWTAVVRGHPQGLAVFLWGLLLYWQVLPIVTSSAAEGFEPGGLLRFPLTYPAYFLSRMLYGSLDTMTAIALLCLLGMWTGIGIAQASLLPWAALVLLVFALTNLLLARTVFAWVERWLARRRTRELMGLLFLVLTLSTQMMGRTLGHSRATQHPGLLRLARLLAPIERLSPPGLAAASITAALHGHASAALLALGGLGIFAAIFALLLHLRLRAQYLGENLSEASIPQPRRGLKIRSGSNGPSSIPAPVAAVMTKEFQYLLRSGPQLLGLLVPVFMLFVFRSRDAPFSYPARLMFPMGVAYALLTLPQLVYNIFGSDSSGVQFYYFAPVALRTVVFSKNLFHSGIFALQVAILWLAVGFLYRPPSSDVLLATISWVLFALAVSLAVGNVISFWSPKRVDLSKFGRSRVSGVSGLVGFLVLLASIAAGVFALAWSRRWGSLLPLVPLFLALAAIAFGGYWIVMLRVDGLAERRREAILGELGRV